MYLADDPDLNLLFDTCGLVFKYKTASLYHVNYIAYALYIILFI